MAFLIGLRPQQPHYGDLIMGAIASQITSLTIVYSTVYSDADQRKHQSSASLAFVWGIHRGPVNSPHKWPVTRKMLPFDDVIMHTSPVCFDNLGFSRSTIRFSHPLNQSPITLSVAFSDRVDFPGATLAVCLEFGGCDWLLYMSP